MPRVQAAHPDVPLDAEDVNHTGRVERDPDDDQDDLDEHEQDAEENLRNVQYCCLQESARQPKLSALQMLLG